VSKPVTTVLILVVAMVSTIGTGIPYASPELTMGETLYVPIYSHIYGGPRSRPINVAATLSIRNTDQTGSITVTSVKYYDSTGKFIKDYSDQKVTVDPLGTIHFMVEEFDTSGGSGANFIVAWKSAKRVNSPIIQAVHVSTRSGQGISFITSGKIIQPHEDRTSKSTQ
jgi:hypothetical protein